MSKQRVNCVNVEKPRAKSHSKICQFNVPSAPQQVYSNVTSPSFIWQKLFQH